jgi:hypothetical protein
MEETQFEVIGRLPYVNLPGVTVRVREFSATFANQRDTLGQWKEPLRPHPQLDRVSLTCQSEGIHLTGRIWIKPVQTRVTKISGCGTTEDIRNSRAVLYGTGTLDVLYKFKVVTAIVGDQAWKVIAPVAIEFVVQQKTARTRTAGNTQQQNNRN